MIRDLEGGTTLEENSQPVEVPAIEVLRSRYKR
jgi:hypothetical protein